VVAVGKLVEKELKGILQKDINKKLCESYAFLLFDKWWADKVQQFSATFYYRSTGNRSTCLTSTGHMNK
jgi:hypothetical protein